MLYLRSSVRGQINHNLFIKKESKLDIASSNKYLMNFPFFFAVGVEMGDWQEVWDENSGCYYYWNTLSNEVSWELPHYLADQMQSMGQYSNR